MSSLDALFHPKSVAVIGASRSRTSVGGQIFHNLIACEFNGPVYPINPSAPEVQSVPAYPSILDVPHAVDLAVISVPRDRVLAAVHDCGKKGVRGVIVITAGFGETGSEGAALQDELLKTSRSYGMRLVGPNCLGLLSTDPSVRLDATFATTWPPAGNVSFSSQSGALGLAILDDAKELGIGLRHFVSVGNKADVSGNDLLEHWETDPETRVILLYLESFGNPRRFLEIARRVSRTKPIVAVKAGRSEAGARAASSHTGALAGREVAVDALLHQAGVIRTSTLEELFDVASLLSTQPVPVGKRVGILTNAGGPAIMAADACEARGLLLPVLAEATQGQLRAALPAEASVRNPVDMIASATAHEYEAALAPLIADPNVDAVMVLFIPTIRADAVDVARAVTRIAATATKPILACFMGGRAIDEGRAILRAARVPVYAFPESASAALAGAAHYGAWRASADDVQDAPGASPVVIEPSATKEKRWLRPSEVRALLWAHGIPTLPGIEVSNEDAAARAAAAIGLPVALKLVSDSITHKSEVGGVHLDLRTEDAVRAAYRGLADALARVGRSDEMQGALVQAMAPRGVETFVGMTRDRAFGPLVAFGSGGVAVELWKDVVFRLAPITTRDAREMLDAIRGKALLDGFRGAPPADRDAIVDVLLRVSRMVLQMPEIVELDINPLLALEPGRGVVALDARVRVGV